MTLWFSRMCAAFNRLPTEIERERLRLPVGFLEAILEARAYENAKAIYDANPKIEKKSEMVALAEVITFDLAREAIEAAKRKTKT